MVLLPLMSGTTAMSHSLSKNTCHDWIFFANLAGVLWSYIRFLCSPLALLLYAIYLYAKWWLHSVSFLTLLCCQCFFPLSSTFNKKIYRMYEKRDGVTKHSAHILSGYGLSHRLRTMRSFADAKCTLSTTTWNMSIWSNKINQQTTHLNNKEARCASDRPRMA